MIPGLPGGFSRETHLFPLKGHLWWWWFSFPVRRRTHSSAGYPPHPVGCWFTCLSLIVIHERGIRQAAATLAVLCRPGKGWRLAGLLPGNKELL